MDSSNSSYPDSILVSGEVVGYCNSYGCGVISSSGVLKLRVDKNPRYHKKYMYIVVPCLYFNDSLLGKPIKDLKVYAVTPNRYKTLSLIVNRYNSNGVPFYCAKDGNLIIDKLSKK